MRLQINYHGSRFEFNARRNILWNTLCKYYFSTLISEKDCVLDLGCGYGEFISNVKARRRIALDSWPGFVDYLDPSIECIVSDIRDLSHIENGSVDFAFASNLFEHVSQADFSRCLQSLRDKLSEQGTLNILQPNYRYAFKEYYDDYTHISVYSHVSLCDFLRANDFEIIETKPRFLPLTIKSRLPVSPLLIRLYLSSPFKPFAKQMFVRSGPKVSS